MTDGETIRFGKLVKIVRGRQASRARHILDNEARIARDMLAHITGHQTRIKIIATAWRVAHYQTDGFALIKILRLYGGGDNQCRRDQKHTDRKSKSFKH